MRFQFGRVTAGRARARRRPNRVIEWCARLSFYDGKFWGNIFSGIIPPRGLFLRILFGVLYEWVVIKKIESYCVEIREKFYSIKGAFRR